MMVERTQIPFQIPFPAQRSKRDNPNIVFLS
jgi:hypothetical protein